MTCEDVVERGTVEDYLLDRLTDEERDAFEQHYFTCARCHAEVEALRDVQDALRRSSAPAVSRQAASWTWLAAAALVVLAVGAAALMWRAAEEPGGSSPPMASRESETPPPSQPSAPLSAPQIDAQLARVEPPPYEPRRLRTGGSRPEFVAGMERYQAADYAGALPLLERALAGDPAFEPARFYLGATQMLAGRPQAGVRTLEALAARTDSPYAEEARFLSAKAHLNLGEQAAAVRALDATIALRGEREADARRIKAALPQVP